MRMRVLYEYVIPNEMIPAFMDTVRLHAEWDDMPVLEYCQNLLARSYPSVIIRNDDEEDDTT